MYNIAFVEDSVETTERIKDYVARFIAETGEPVNATYFSDGLEIVDNYQANFSAVFLDIQLKHLDGMRTAEMIRKHDPEVILIFMTNMSQYAIKGYAVQAMDFLLKPVPYFAFSEQLKRCIEIIKKKSVKNLLVPTAEGTVKLNTDSIIFIESIKHKMILHCADQDYSMFSSIKELEEKLVGSNFYRIGASYLVNLAYVNGIKGSMVNVRGTELAVSRQRKKEFMQALALFVGDFVK